MTSLSDANRYGEMNIALTCPKCGSSGLIPWQRLDRALFCRGCSSLYRVEATGLVELEERLEEKFSVQVRSSSSEWHDHEAVIEKPSSLARRLRARARELATSAQIIAVVACGLVCLAMTGFLTLAPRSDPPPQVEIPRSLDERAVLLTESIARRQTETVLALTDPAEHRALRIWLAHGKDVPPRISDEIATLKAEIVSRAKTTADGNNVDLRVRLPCARDGARGKPIELTQRWVRNGKNWYFRPVRLRSRPPANAGPQKVRGKSS